MPITATKKGKEYPLIPEDTYHGVCYCVIDLGTQPNPVPTYDDMRKVLIGWEIPSLRIEIEKDGNVLGDEHRRHKI